MESDDTTQALSIARDLGVPYASRENKILVAQKNQGLADLIPEDFAVSHAVFPLFLDGNTLAVAMARPDDALALERMRLITRCEIQPFVARRDELMRAISGFYRTRPG